MKKNLRRILQIGGGEGGGGEGRQNISTYVDVTTFGSDEFGVKVEGQRAVSRCGASLF